MPVVKKWRSRHNRKHGASSLLTKTATFEEGGQNVVVVVPNNNTLRESNHKVVVADHHHNGNNSTAQKITTIHGNTDKDEVENTTFLGTTAKSSTTSTDADTPPSEKKHLQDMAHLVDWIGTLLPFLRYMGMSLEEFSVDNNSAGSDHVEAKEEPHEETTEHTNVVVDSGSTTPPASNHTRKGSSQRDKKSRRKSRAATIPHEIVSSASRVEVQQQPDDAKRNLFSLLRLLERARGTHEMQQLVDIISTQSKIELEERNNGEQTSTTDTTKHKDDAANTKTAERKSAHNATKEGKPAESTGADAPAANSSSSWKRGLLRLIRLVESGKKTSDIEKYAEILWTQSKIEIDYSKNNGVHKSRREKQRHNTSQELLTIVQETTTSCSSTVDSSRDLEDHTATVAGTASSNSNSKKKKPRLDGRYSITGLLKIFESGTASKFLNSLDIVSSDDNNNHADVEIKFKDNNSRNHKKNSSKKTSLRKTAPFFGLLDFDSTKSSLMDFPPEIVSTLSYVEVGMKDFFSGPTAAKGTATSHSSSKNDSALYQSNYELDEMRDVFPSLSSETSSFDPGIMATQSKIEAKWTKGFLPFFNVMSFEMEHGVGEEGVLNGTVDDSHPEITATLSKVETKWVGKDYMSSLGLSFVDEEEHESDENTKPVYPTPDVEEILSNTGGSLYDLGSLVSPRNEVADTLPDETLEVSSELPTLEEQLTILGVSSNIMAEDESCDGEVAVAPPQPQVESTRPRPTILVNKYAVPAFQSLSPLAVPPEEALSPTSLIHYSEEVTKTADQYDRNRAVRVDTFSPSGGAIESTLVSRLNAPSWGNDAFLNSISPAKVSHFRKVWKATPPERQQEWIEAVKESIKESKEEPLLRHVEITSVGSDSGVLSVEEAAVVNRQADDELSVSSLDLLCHWLMCSEIRALPRKTRIQPDPRGMVIEADMETRLTTLFSNDTCEEDGILLPVGPVANGPTVSPRRVKGAKTFTTL